MIRVIWHFMVGDYGKMTQNFTWLPTTFDKIAQVQIKSIFLDNFCQDVSNDLTGFLELRIFPSLFWVSKFVYFVNDEIAYQVPIL